ncbi:hypothetical protein AAC387_Pa04g1478 [Persea americana]
MPYASCSTSLCATGNSGLAGDGNVRLDGNGEVRLAGDEGGGWRRIEILVFTKGPRHETHMVRPPLHSDISRVRTEEGAFFKRVHCVISPHLRLRPSTADWRMD